MSRAEHPRGSALKPPVLAEVRRIADQASRPPRELPLPSWENVALGSELSEVVASRKLYEKSLTEWHGWRQIYDWLHIFGVEDFLNELPTILETGDLTKAPGWSAAIAKIPPESRTRMGNQFPNILRLVRGVLSKPVHFDEDLQTFVNQLSDEEQAEIWYEVVQEQIRIGEACAELLKLQERELKREIRQQRQQTQVRKPHQRLKKEVIVRDVQPQLQVEEHMGLIADLGEPTIVTVPWEGWNVFYTEDAFNVSPERLHPIPAGSQEVAVSAVSEIVRTKGKSAPIKPISIVRAIAFHLRKDVIQRAHSLRNKYGEHRDWIKLKRGAARLFFMIDETSRSCIFFVGHRKDVYQNI